MTTNRRTRGHFQGCLLGGAIGDALGWPIEFDPWDSIRRRYGPEGIQELDPRGHRLAQVTDDTQMTLFTAEGLLVGLAQGLDRDPRELADMVHQAYLRWLSTQDETSRHPDFAEVQHHGWLGKVAALQVRRAPGNTCLAGTRSQVAGSRAHPLNDSAGCGALMRMAPVGLIVADPVAAFALGADCGALTHGSPSGYLPAGFFAAVIARLVAGEELRPAIDATIPILKQYEGHKPVLDLLERALQTVGRPLPSPEVLHGFGGGWQGHEAMAISLCCALAAGEDFARGVRLAVNHSGDSDSTGSITGNLLGLLLGLEAIPQRWRDGVELAAEIGGLATDLLQRHEDSTGWRARYGSRQAEESRA
ncbi:MAG: ADP-ribosylglycohydrolase family protein [Myxococcota bacterium]|jgi:ADP-ribosylglycohydrolase|nr:ADP-ribosylglycohydrolase family protein [Myxococcota bacterium]